MNNEFKNGELREYLRRVFKDKYLVADSAPSTFQELNASKTATLTVWTGASQGTVWGLESSNWHFRAWHDSIHLRHQFDFSKSGELKATEVQCVEASRLVGDSFASIIEAEVKGQVEHFEKFGRFPENQLEFILEYLRTGALNQC